MVACSQCRQRKVRCQGSPRSCDACTRLGFQCSYSATPTSGPGTGNVPATRRRGARACDACRTQRSRCSGGTPCIRCQQLDVTCHYSLSVRQYQAGERSKSATSVESSLPTNQRHEVMSVANSTPTTQSDIVASPATSASGRLDKHLGCERTLIRQHIDAYFEYIYPVPLYSFLHRADFLGRYSKGELAPALLLAVCGTSSRFLHTITQANRLSKSWIEKAERMLFQSFGRTTVQSIQALVLIGLYHSHNNNSSKSFLYVALAVRMAYSLKLHKEDGRLPFLDQECRRRLMWCLFITDRFQAGGVPEYLVLSTVSLQIQLPCPESNFQVDMPINTPHLQDKSASKSELSMSTLLLRIFDVRNRILLYAKQLLDTSSSPEQSLPQFQFFEQELKSILDSLPPELAFSTRAYQLRAFSPERTTFITLHIYFHHCHCELYRLLNPGYREALPNTVIMTIMSIKQFTLAPAAYHNPFKSNNANSKQSTSPDLVAYAQSRCLSHATSIGEIISTTHSLVDTDLYMTDMSCFVVLYQASCAILYACHRESPAYTMSPNTARRYFVAFIETLAKLLIYFPRFAIYVNDIRNMLRSIDEPNAPLPPQKAATEVDFRARMVSSEEGSDEENAGGKTQDRTLAVSDEAGSSQTAYIQDIGSETMELIDLSMQATAPMEDDYGLGSYLGSSQFGFDASMDHDQGLLWDWADALESGFNLEQHANC